MTKKTSKQVREHEGSLYASHEDFHTIFNEDLKKLYQLSLLLTLDPAKAERGLVRGLEDCVSGNRVFPEWARSWAKRTTVQNAIRELKPRPGTPIHSVWSYVLRHRQKFERFRQTFRNARVFGA